MSALLKDAPPRPNAGSDPDERRGQLLGSLEVDAQILASIALASAREARFGDDIPALRDALKTARLVLIQMLQAFNLIEGAQ